jgi:hypothetical protein
MGETGFMVVFKAVWAWFLSVFPLFFGVAYSLSLDRERLKQMSKFELALSVFFGVYLAYVFSNAIAEHFVINPLSFGFILMQVVLAAIGGSIFNWVIQNTPTILTNLKDIVLENVKSWLGRK